MREEVWEGNRFRTLPLPCPHSHCASHWVSVERKKTLHPPPHTSNLPTMRKYMTIQHMSTGKTQTGTRPPPLHTQLPQSASLHTQILCGTLPLPPHSRDFSQGSMEKAYFQEPGFWCQLKVCQFITEWQATGIVQLVEGCLPCRKPRVRVQTRHTHEPSTQEVEAGRSEVQGYLIYMKIWSQSELHETLSQEEKNY